jgi:RHS repeat-associated protein
MSSSTLLRHVSGCFLLVTLGALGSVAQAQTVGRTAGSFSVSPMGAATYTIPIWSPPGPKGIQPKVALVYNSQSGNGSLGVGWNLAGLSSIYRCNLTYAQDAAPAAVTLSTSDGYCLDGQRLRLTSGTYGVAGSTYQTEIANFQNVTAYGAAGNGPAYFTVQTPGGRTLTYGNGGSSQVLASGTSTAVSWLLNEVSDPAGNTMTISYSTATGTAVPSTISWTPATHGSASYLYTMVFSYGTNELPPTGYVAGTPFQNPNLLGSITINYNGSQVKEYVLTYQQSGTTSRDRLTQVQECSTSTSSCLYPTAITYQNGGVGVSPSATTAVSSALTSCTGGNGSIARYDFNGDGYTDLLYKASGTCYVAFGSASGYGTPVSTGISGALLAVDLLGTGKLGILANNGGTWYYYTWNGSSFVGTSTGLAYDSTAQQFALADINGDGLPDLVALYYNGSSVTITTRQNTSSGSTPSFSGSAVTAFTQSGASSGLFSPDSEPGNVPFFDFNGDGRQDLAVGVVNCSYYYMGACQVYATGIYELISQPNGTFSGALLTLIPTQFSLSGNLAFANINNDACTDAVVFGYGIYISACNGGSGANLSSTYPVVAVMDWNGDGLADLIENDGGTLYVQLSTGTGFAAATSTSIAYAANCTYIALDANGDGLDDLACASSQSGTTGFVYYLHNGPGQMPDLMASITDGYGNFVQPSYVSLTQSVNATYYEWNDAVFPYLNYNGPLYLASKAVFSDPTSATGGTYYRQYGYAGLWMNLQGRGLTPMGNVQIYDSRTALLDTLGYERLFPWTGMLSAELRTDNNFTPWQNAILYYWTTTTPTLAQVTLSSTPGEQRYFPYFSNSTVQNYELGASATHLVRTASTNYSYDNYGNALSIVTTVTDNDSGSPYYNQSWSTTTTNTPDPNTSTWCLNLLTETQVAYSSTLSGSGAVTRTKTFTPDTTNCRYTQTVTEPSSSYYKVTEAFGYDAFGNVNSDTVTGVNMSARQTTLNWGTTGELPTTVIDPAGNALGSAGYQQVNSYDYSKGVLTSQVVQSITGGVNNAPPTTWQYDGFGRRTQETRPDGTSTQWSYNNCSTYNQCLLGSNTLAVSRYEYAYGGGLTSSGTTYSDMLERPLMSNYSLLSGYYRRDLRYDNLGHIAQRASPCIWVSFSTPCTYWTKYGYDVLNRVTEVQRPINASSGQTSCNPLTIPPATGCEGTSYSYAGGTTTVTDPYNNTKTIVNDVNGWLRQTKDAYGYNVTLAYDAAGAKTSVTDSLSNPLWSGTYQYGIAPFLTGENDMDRGIWSYTVDALGERTAWGDPNHSQALVFSETYDALSRPLTRNEPDLFTQWTWGSSASSHNIGKPASVCTGTGGSPTNCTGVPGYSEAETYDSLSRLSQRSITLPGEGTYTYTYGYNPAGQLGTVTYPTSTNSCQVVVNYGYTNGILSSLTDGSNQSNCHMSATVFWQANTQAPDGNITEETLGNGIVTNKTFDAVTHWLQSVQAGVGGGTGVKNLSFLYDEMGNVTLRQDGTGTLNLNENIYYDKDYRLSYTTLGSTQNLSVTYDPTGNISSRSDVAGGATWTYDPIRKHAVTQAGSSTYTYSYDANGNMNSHQGSTINWSSYNYPTLISAGSGSTAESVALYYGPARQRWYQYYSGNGTTENTYYAGPLEIVTSGSVTSYRHYIYAGDEPVAVYSRTSSGTNAVDYVLSDHQGSAAALTNGSGATIVSESFTPYGTRRNPTTWSGAASNLDLTTAAGITRQAYTFQTQLGLWMGMNHMNGRVEDAVIGRFISADPKIPDPTNAQDYNRYSYVDNNPLTFTDPSGFDGWNPASPALNCLTGGSMCTTPVPCTGSRLSCGVGLIFGCAGNCVAVNTLAGNVTGIAGGPSAGGANASKAASDSGDNSSNGTTSDQQAIDPYFAAAFNQALGPLASLGDPDAPPVGWFENGTFGPADLTGSFACGSFQCSYQMGPYSLGGGIGTWIRVSLTGDLPDGQWVQTATDSTGMSHPDCDPKDCPFYPSYASGAAYFGDDPARPPSWSVTWVGQTSYVRPYQNGAAFTFQWGFTLSNGSVSYIPPALATPWPSQQSLIWRANQWNP